MLAITGDRILTMTDRGTVAGTLLISEKRIFALEPGYTVPDGAEHMDFRGRVIMPGMIDPHTHLGIAEEGTGQEGREYNELEDPFTPHLRAIDALNPTDTGFKDARRAGITAVGVTPGSMGVVAGQTAVVKTRGRTLEEMLVREPSGVKAALGENPKRFFGHEQRKPPLTRMACAALIREGLLTAEHYGAQVSRNEGRPSRFLERDLKKEILVRVLRREIPLRIHAHLTDDIMTAVRIAEEFGIRLVLEHCTEGHLVARELAEAGFPAVVGPTMSSRSKVELKGKTFATPAALKDAGLTVALTTDHPITPVRYLPLAAALAVRAGLPASSALRAITRDAARILGVGEQLGSITVGRDADLVVFRDQPPQPYTEPEAVFIDGRRVL